MIRVRFAPSPTGPLHIGGLRTALFNYLFAKKNNGTFILRIEDTDQKRFVEGAEQYIIDALKWCNINIDEGVSAGGKFEPYRQSERKEIYQKYVKQLIDNDKAYYAFDTPEELNAMRDKLKKEKSSVQHYNYVTRVEMKNSFTLSKAEVKEKINSGEPYVIRFNIPNSQTIELDDIIRGKIKIDTNTLDDKVIFKSDGLPTYHLANIVDDYLMEITHVIRGEEWLPSLPLHVLLYEAFEWEKPKFAHLPLILKPNGKGKLSKRDGQKMGFPVFPLNWSDPKTNEQIKGYKEWGYFPEAVTNILALLGWNSGSEQEIFSMDELINAFSLDKIQKAGAKFDVEKTKWFNRQYLKTKSDNELAELFMPILSEKNIKAELQTVEKIVALIKERAVYVSDFWDLTSFFFIAPDKYDKKSRKKSWKDTAPKIITDLKSDLNNIEDFNSKNIETIITKSINDNNLGFGKVLMPLRLLLVGDMSGPHVFDIIELLGKEETIKRIDTGLMQLQK